PRGAGRTNGGGGSTVPGVSGGEPAGRTVEPLATAVAALTDPGLVVLVGGPGIGRSTALRRLAETFRGPVFAGGGLAMLRGVPAFALARAVRVRLPGQDRALLAEAVRSRVRGGLLLLDDLQWADPVTLAALPAIAAHCRIAVTLRTPHLIDAEPLRRVAAAWLTVPTLNGADASALVARVAPGLLAPDQRRALHRRLADLVPAREAARHLAAAGEPALAYQRALAAAEQTGSLGERAELLALACELPGTTPTLDVRLRTATAA